MHPASLVFVSEASFEYGSNIYDKTTVSKPGPLWFRKMDRNGDGDLSPREFLGPIKDFKKFDSDKDGLIDAAEAGK